MNIAIIGLGYVGIVTGTCLSSIGHRVYGCDISQKKVNLLLNGTMPFLEPGSDELLEQGLSRKTFFAATDINLVLDNADTVFICVGTPSKKDGSVNLSFLEKVTEQIGEYLHKTSRWIGVCVRSTIPVGTIGNIVIPTLEVSSGKISGKDFGVAFCPEFLREGNAIDDFLNPPVTVVASTDKRMQLEMTKLWRTLPGNFSILNVSFENAEMCKYAANAFHALKISFANEIGLLSTQFGADGKKVMDILISDTTLNISPKYLKPGFAFGGSCLPKDLRALEAMAAQSEIKLPLIESILTSNDSIIDINAKMILRYGRGVLGFAGITFKDGTDDLRESSVLKLIYLLHDQGKQIAIYDKNIDPKIFTGVNLAIWNEFINKVVPAYHTDVERFIQCSETIITHGEQQEVKDELENCESSKSIINLTDDSENQYVKNQHHNRINYGVNI
jgi:GDP-mannose 6-dehydrogenase